MTGHSLGGGIAAAVSMVVDLPAVTFNPAGVHPATLKLWWGSLLFTKLDDKIVVYRVDGEILGYLQDSSMFGNILGFMMPNTNGTQYTIRAKSFDNIARHMFDDIYYGLRCELDKARRKK